MGATQSTPKTFVVNKESLDIPIEFNEGFIENISSSDQKKMDNLLQQKVDYELDLIREKRIIQENRMARQVLKEAEELLARQRIPQLNISPTVEKAQHDVILCYRNNPNTVLDCYKEIQAFKRAEHAVLEVICN
jgi:hypothetical protein